MPWTIQYSKQAEKQLSKLPSTISARIRDFMEQRVAKLEKPAEIARKLSGPYEDKVRYRVGDYRVVCEIHKHVLLILVVELGHEERFIADRVVSGVETEVNG